MQQDLNLLKLNIIIGYHIQSLKNSFENNLPSQKTTCEWNASITNPFITYDSGKLNVSDRKYESIFEISTDIMLKACFEQCL